jgi:hypothetical protein
MAANPQPERPRRPAARDDATEKSAGERPSEFQRFQDLTRKLLRVPKPELDTKRKAS